MAKKDAAEQPEAKSNKKLIIIIVAAVVLLFGVGVGVFLFMGAKNEEISPEDEQSQQAQAQQIGPMVNIDTFIVNILDDEESRYLKAAITVEVDGQSTAMELTERMPQIKDAILLLVGNKTFSELQDLQGKIQLRAELINRLNSILAKGKVKRIYFTDFVVQ